MAKTLQKLLAMFTAISVCMSLLSFSALATGTEGDEAENSIPSTETATESGTVEVESIQGGGKAETVDVTITFTTGENTTEKETAEGGDTTASGLTVNYKSAETVDENGNVISGESSYTVSGSENVYGAEGGSEYRTEQIPCGPGVTVEVPLSEGETNRVEAEVDVQEGTAPTDEGDDLKEENPAIYDQTTTTVQEGSVSVTTNSVAVTGNSDVGGEYASDKDIGLDPVNSEWTGNEYNVLEPEVKLTDEQIAAALQNKPEGYDFLYFGKGEASMFGVDWDNRNSGTFAGQFQLADGTTMELTDEEKYVFDIVTAYCTDLGTSAIPGYWYSVENLEDVDYFKDENAEEHIRSIVMNGYWGTEPYQDQETGETINPVGSLAAVKAMMADAKDEAGNPVFAPEEIAALTEGEALTATQMSVWLYGNPYQQKLDLMSSPYYGIIKAESPHDMDEWLKNHPDMKTADGTLINTLDTDAAKQARQDALKRIDKLSAYLTTLTQEAEETDIISEEKFIDELSITVGEKTKENADGNGNDAYSVDLTFALVVTPGKDDDLIVKVINGEGEVVSMARIAGDGSNDSGFSQLTETTENGKTNYTLAGLELIEGSNTKFNLKLEGAQYLEKGVYVYTSQIREYDLNGNGVIEDKNRDGDCERTASSQTFVGIAEGYKSVNVSMEVDLSFNVEDSTITTERVWRTEWNSVSNPDPGHDPNPGPDPNPDPDPAPDPAPEPDPNPEPKPDHEPEPNPYPYPDPKSEHGVIGVIPDEEDPQVDTIKKESLLAEVPKTGDTSALWLVLSALSGTGLVGFTFMDRKKRKEI